MRFRKGSIELSHAQDIPLLKRVLGCGFVTHDQLFHFQRLGCYELNRKCFNWRIRRLVTHEFVARHELPGVASDFVYSIGRRGVMQLQGMGEYYSGSPTGLAKTIDEMSVCHAVELNDIQLRLMADGLLVDWKSEVEIRSQNELTGFGYAKDYDAIVTMELSRRRSQFALEYERSPKGYKEYSKIHQAMERETAVERFLYLVTNEHLQSFVAHCFAKATRPVCLALVQDFLANPPGAVALEVPSHRRSPLSELL